MATKKRKSSGNEGKELVGTKNAKLGRLEEFRSLDAAKKAALDSDQNYPKIAKNKQGMFFVCCKHTARKRGLTIVARKIEGKMVAVTA